MGAPNWSNKTILVVEDEEVNRFFFQSVLRVTNANVLYAENGLEAIKMVTNHTKIDCVLMDVRMPVINGYEATRTIKKKRKELPVIIQSAYVLSRDRIKAFEAGCDEFITKPIQIDLLYSLVSKHIQSHTQVN